MSLTVTYLLAKKKIEYNISAFEIPQKEINRSYSTFCNDIALAKLRTCACFSVTGVPKFANTAVWANSIVAVRVHVTGGRQSGAFINICSKREKCFSHYKY